MSTERSDSANLQPVEHSIAAARQGSFSALGQLLEHYRDYLLHIANGELENDLVVKAAPSDLVQESFLQAARDFPRFTGKSEPELRAWLRQILLNNVRDTVKRWQGTLKRAGNEVPLEQGHDNTTQQAEPIAPGPSASTIFRTDEDRQAVREALRRLPDEYQLVIDLRTFQSLPFDEVGTRMNRTSEAARKLWTRAIERLTDELPGQNGHDRPAR